MTPHSQPLADGSLLVVYILNLKPDCETQYHLQPRGT